MLEEVEDSSLLRHLWLVIKGVPPILPTTSLSCCGLPLLLVVVLVRAGSEYGRAWGGQFSLGGPGYPILV